MLDQGHLDKWGRAAQSGLNDAQLLRTHVPNLSAGMVALPPAKVGHTAISVCKAHLASKGRLTWRL